MATACNHASGCRGLSGGEGGSGKRCGEAAERFTGKDSLSEGLIRGKGIKVISSMSNHTENGGNRTGSTKRRSRLWNHLIWSYSCGIVTVRTLGKKEIKIIHFSS